MCEYIQHLEKFKKYKYPCKRKTKDILESKDSLTLLLDCLNINTLESNTVYVFYRTDKVIHHSIKLNAKKEKDNIKRLEDLKSDIIEGSEGYLELYVFCDENKNDKSQFNKLYDLINEFCNVDKIKNDYKDNFTTKFIHVAEDFLLDTYTLISTKNLRFFSVLLLTFMILEYVTLINAGYPFEIIDKFSMLFLSQYILYILGAGLVLVYLVATLVTAYLSKTHLSKNEGNKIFQKIISTMLYLFLIIIIFIKIQYSETINKLFLDAYNSIHIYPRLAIDNSIYKLIIDDDTKTMYTYNIEQIIDKNVTNIICKETNSSIDSNNILSTIMRKSTHIDIKNIILEKSNKSLQLIDNNISQKIIIDKFCHE